MEQLTSRANPQIRQAAALGRSAKARREAGCFLLEGLRLCVDALASGWVPAACFVTRGALDKWEAQLTPLLARAEQAYQITPEIAALLAQTQTPQGVFCVFKTLDKTSHGTKIERDGKYIALEQIQDPANLGAVCRTAEALGLTGVVLSGCCDIYNPKAQRAAMGALLRLPLFPAADLPAFLREQGAWGMLTLAAVPEKGARYVTSLALQGGVICVVGNEGNGVTQETKRACRHCVTIPMRGRAESLNASMAAAILMWEMMRA